MIKIPGVGSFKDEQQLAQYLATFPPEKLTAAQQLMPAPPIWTPQPGPQEEAFNHEATMLFYGGAAGGGKTDLALGLAVTKHVRTLFVRKEFSQLTAAMERLAELLGSTEGLNKSTGTWHFNYAEVAKVIHFRGMNTPGSEQRFQGSPHDLIVVDECTQLPLHQIRYILTWLRSTDPNAPEPRALFTFNPPSSKTGIWVLNSWPSAWVNPRHQGDKAKSGETRFFINKEGADIEVPTEERITLEDGSTVPPTSVSFIQAKLVDNKYLGDAYRSGLQSLPEPLRSQMLFGDMSVGMTEDSPMQLIPSQWIEDAMARHRNATHLQNHPGVMMLLAVDVARGGRDQTVLAKRYSPHDRAIGPYITLDTFPGVSTPDSSVTAGMVMGHLKDRAVIAVDAVGVGSGVADRLNEMQQNVHMVIGSRKAHQRTANGTLGFNIEKAFNYWNLRECLDPENELNICLPDDGELFAELIAMEFEIVGKDQIKVSTKKEVIVLLGRSPDKADAVCMALLDIEKTELEHYARLDAPAKPVHVEPEYEWRNGSLVEIMKPKKYQHANINPRQRRYSMATDPRYQAVEDDPDPYANC